MKILALPSPHHYELPDGTPVEGWADADGMVIPIVYKEEIGGLVPVDAVVRPRAARRGQFSPYGRHMPDVPEEVKAHLDAREEQ